ncbi:TonB-dependent receptor plug domain-containing protein, partial [Bordetella hinzii]|nr:TonB-dependent receptor plug domain-containing protein [Bordetella hinzii]
MPIGKFSLPLAAALVAASLASAPACAQAARYDIPAGSLDQVLNAYARQAGVTLSADSALTADRQSNGLHGSYGLEEGFAALLARHGLAIRPGSQAGAYVVQPAPAAELPAIPVNATRGVPNPGLVPTQTATATKTDTSLLETPQSVSVVTREAMDMLGAQTVSQALRYSAGVLPDNAGAETRYDWINIRGVSESTLGLYLNGLRLQSNTEFRIEPYGLEQLDVMRGPSSVLYGQNAPGGLINMVSKKPTDTTLREIQLLGGSYQNRQAAFDFSGAVDDDHKVLYRLTGLARHS